MRCPARRRCWGLRRDCILSANRPSTTDVTSVQSRSLVHPARGRRGLQPEVLGAPRQVCIGCRSRRSARFAGCPCANHDPRSPSGPAVPSRHDHSDDKPGGDSDAGGRAGGTVNRDSAPRHRVPSRPLGSAAAAPLPPPPSRPQAGRPRRPARLGAGRRSTRASSGRRGLPEPIGWPGRLIGTGSRTTMAAAAWMPSRLARALVESRHSRGQMPRPLFSAWLFAEAQVRGSVRWCAGRWCAGRLRASAEGRDWPAPAPP